MARGAAASSGPQLARGALYLAALYAWWCVCAHHFEVVPPRIVHPLPQQPAARAVDSSVAASSAASSAGAEAGARAAQAVEKVAAPADGGDALAVATAATITAGHADISDTSGCPAGRRPYHTLLTAQGSIYNQWQARIMYHHWKKQRARDGPCTEMSGFTRLCPSPNGEPDGVEKHIPTIFVAQLSKEVLAQYGHFGVLNRPHSVVEMFKLPDLRKRITEEYVLVAETDHVLMRPLPNLATATTAAAHSFGYMHAGSHHQRVVSLVNPQASWKDLQPVGPSPLIIKLSELERVAPRWLDYSFKLRADPMPARLIQDWVLEMWGCAARSPPDPPASPASPALRAATSPPRCQLRHCVVVDGHPSHDRPLLPNRAERIRAHGR